ncbi:MAG: hypothetical protein JKY37_32355 [Nannocystaceae bacterium]|nr:hypothetical protein [Nannocystaceae bacterium]
MLVPDELAAPPEPDDPESDDPEPDDPEPDDPESDDPESVDPAVVVEAASSSAPVEEPVFPELSSSAPVDEASADPGGNVVLAAVGSG